jgi:hypothetical protein
MTCLPRQSLRHWQGPFSFPFLFFFFDCYDFIVENSHTLIKFRFATQGDISNIPGRSTVLITNGLSITEGRARPYWFQNQPRSDSEESKGEPYHPKGLAADPLQGRPR